MLTDTIRASLTEGKLWNVTVKADEGTVQAGGAFLEVQKVHHSCNDEAWKHEGSCYQTRYVLLNRFRLLAWSASRGLLVIDLWHTQFTQSQNESWWSLPIIAWATSTIRISRWTRKKSSHGVNESFEQFTSKARRLYIHLLCNSFICCISEPTWFWGNGERLLWQTISKLMSYVAMRSTEFLGSMPQQYRRQPHW